MSDELLDYAIAQVEKWGDMGHMPLVKKLVERVLDAEAERDALRALLYRAYPYIEDVTYDEGEALQAKRTLLSDIDAALKESP